MTISQNSAIWNCTNTWKGVFFSLFSTCFCFPFFLLPHLHLRWLLILTSKIVQTTSVVRLHPPHTHIHSHTFFQIIVELNHNSLIKRRNQAFAPNSHLWGKSSIKIAHFSFYSFLTFRGVVVAAPLSQDTSGNPSFYTFIPSPLESLPQAPPPKEIKIEKRFPVTLQMSQKPKEVIFLFHPLTHRISHLFPNKYTIFLMYGEKLGNGKVIWNVLIA